MTKPQPKRANVGGNIALATLVLVLFLLTLPVTIYLIKQKAIFKSRAAGTATKPNVLVIMTDDLDEGSMNQLLAAGKLPNIKKYLLDRGIRFVNSFVTESICCSSRATFLTGKYSHNTGVYNVFGTEAGMRGLVTKGLAKTDPATSQITSVDWLPSWLHDNGYYTGHVGKFMNTYEYGENTKPGFDYWRNITGYDNRPGMYYVWADKNPTPFNPDSYQIKYISDRAADFINNFTQSGTGNFFLELTPHSPHVFIPRWSKEEGAGAFDTNLANPSQAITSFNVFTPPPDQKVLLREQVLKDLGNGDFASWSNDQTTASWTGWNLNGNASTLFAGTGSLPIVSFNAFVNPDTNDIRQHLVRGNLNSGYTIYSRDRSNGSWSPWTAGVTVASLIPDATRLPVISFSATPLSNGGVLQYFLLGDTNNGYFLYDRARIGNVWTSWRKEDDLWDQGTGAYPITAFHATYAGNGLVDLRLVRKDPNTGLIASYVQRVRSFYDSIPQSVLGVTTDQKGISTFRDEAQLYTPNYPINTSVSKTANDILPYPDLIKSFRVMADGNWPNPKSEQSYPLSLYGGKYPAGSLRSGNNPDGFTPISSQFELPGFSLPSFNNPGCATKTPFICNFWPDLNRPVIGNKTELDYLRRQHLDRLESMLSVDVMVGQVASFLQTKNLLDNTLIIFTSDNGFFLGDFRLLNKQLPYEQSIRVPLVIRPPSSTVKAGQDNDNTVANFDLTATIADYANLWSTYSSKIDGRSLLPILTNPTSQYLPWRKWFLEEYRYPRGVDINDWIQTKGVPDLRALRTGVEARDSLDEGNKMVYVEYTRDPLNPTAPTWYEFYDLKSDPYQINNLYNNQTGVLPASYTGLLARYRSIITQLASCQGDSCRNYDTSTNLTWTAQFAAKCASGAQPQIKTRSFACVWPPNGPTNNPLNCSYDPPQSDPVNNPSFLSSSSHTQTIVSSNVYNSVYVSLETDTKLALQPISSQPSGTISFATYFNPPTWMAKWDRSLPQGNYTINFQVPPQLCP